MQNHTEVLQHPSSSHGAASNDGIVASLAHEFGLLVALAAFSATLLLYVVHSCYTKKGSTQADVRNQRTNQPVQLDGRMCCIAVHADDGQGRRLSTNKLAKRTQIKLQTAARG